MHVDRYASRYGVTFNATRKHADLFGRRATGWVVAEAGQLAGLHDRVVDILSDSERRGPAQSLDGTVVETQWEESLTLADWEEYER